MLRKSTPFKWRPPRVRHEPPTLSEALNAARDISDEPSVQIEIAASLMGVMVDEAKTRLADEIGRSAPNATRIAQPSGRRPVLVERRISRAVGPRRLQASAGRESG